MGDGNARATLQGARMKIKRGTPLYKHLYQILQQRPGLDRADPRYLHRYLEMKQIDWALWDQIGGTVLDVACDMPLDAAILSQTPTVERVVLVDIRIPDLSLVPNKATFLAGDATALPFPDNSFDVVTCFSSLEHLPDERKQRQWMCEMVRVTKPGGQLLVTVDNAWSWLNRIWDRYRPPMRRISPHELRDWAAEEGTLTIEASSGGGLYYWGFRPSVRGSARVAYALDRALNPFSSLLPWLGNRVGYRFRKASAHGRRS